MGPLTTDIPGVSSISFRLHTLLALAILMVVASRAAAQELSRAALESRRRAAPDDAVVLYQLAAIEAAAGRRTATLDLLDAVSRAPGGLDPSFSRGFWPLHGDARFEAIVERIRAAHPPIVRSGPAFTIAETDLHPEGIAFDPRSRSLFVGSFKGKIVRVDSLGSATDFVPAPTAGLPEVVVGLRVDPVRRELWAAVDDPRAFGDPAMHGAALHRYDLTTGRRLSRYGPVPGAFNDLVIAPNGDAYATNTTDGSIWTVRAGSDRLTVFLPPGSVVEANGITITPDGQRLYIAGWHDILVVEIASKRIAPLSTAMGVVTASFDGLYWYRDGLVGIQNSIHPGRVVRLTLDSTGQRVRSADILERYHPQFAGMTTAALDGDTLLFLLNTQSRRFNADGTPKAGETLEPIQIVRLPMR